MKTLRTAAFKTMFSTKSTFVMKSFRKVRCFQDALPNGADAFSMYKEVAKGKKDRYVSHRRPAPLEFDAK